LSSKFNLNEYILIAIQNAVFKEEICDEIHYRKIEHSGVRLFFEMGYTQLSNLEKQVRMSIGR
jgi:hypothetical protein